MSNTSIGLESIYVHEQVDDRLELIVEWASKVRSDILFNKYRATAKDLNALDSYKAELEGILKEAFNLKTTVKFSNNFFNFAVVVPHLGKESVMYYGYNDSLMSFFESTDPNEKDLREFVRRNRTAFSKGKTGKVSYKDATVHGAFADMESEIILDPIGTFGFFEADEIASFITHEVGHIFMFFSTLHRTRAVMSTMNNISSDQFKLPPEKRREGLTLRLKDAAACGELPKGAVDTFLASDPDEGIVLMTRLAELTADAIRPEHDRIDSESMFLRLHGLSNEVGADVFVTKLGYGVTLARSLDKWNKVSRGENWAKETQEYEPGSEFTGAMGGILQGLIYALTFTAISSSISAGATLAGPQVVLVITALVVGLLIRYFYILLGYHRGLDFSSYVYDKDQDRIKRILQSEIHVLRQLHKRKDVRIKYMKERIKEASKVADLVGTFNAKSSPYRTLADQLWSKSNHQGQLDELRNAMESLAANPLYLTSLELLYD